MLGRFEKGQAAWNKGIPFSEESKLKMSLAHKGRIAWNKGVTGYHLKSRPPKSAEHKQKLSESVRRYFQENPSPLIGSKLSLERRLHLSCVLKERGIQPSREAKAKGADAVRGKEWTKEHRLHLSMALKGRSTLSPEALKRMATTKRGQHHSIEAKEKMSKVWKKKWENPEYRQKRILQLRKGASISRPTRPEKQLGELLNIACPNQYKYTGNDTFMVGRRFPDFVNCNGQKKVIEVYGDYWHRGQNPQHKESEYAKFGFKCLVIWEHELKEQSKTVLIQRLRNFNGS